MDQRNHIPVFPLKGDRIAIPEKEFITYTVNLKRIGNE